MFDALSFMSSYELAPVGHQKLIMEASQVQIGRSNYNMPSCMSEYRFDIKNNIWPHGSQKEVC